MDMFNSTLYGKSKSDALLGDLVRIKAPAEHAGKIARISGSYFKYPSQNFYVHPAKLEDGTETLVTHFEYLDDDAKKAHEAKVGFVVSLSDREVYDYQKCLCLARCRTCETPLVWQISREKEDDRFCFADCCGIRYSMVPETVRILWDTRREADVIDEDDFLNELSKI